MLLSVVDGENRTSGSVHLGQSLWLREIKERSRWSAATS